MFYRQIHPGTSRKFLKEDATPRILHRLQPEHNYCSTALGPPIKKNDKEAHSNPSSQCRQTLSPLNEGRKITPLETQTLSPSNRGREITPSETVALSSLDISLQITLPSICHGCHINSSLIKAQDTLVGSLKKRIQSLERKNILLQSQNTYQIRWNSGHKHKMDKTKNLKSRQRLGKSARDALNLRLACGQEGYNLVRKYLPLPYIKVVKRGGRAAK
eukprot:TRINITY_DN6322_c0_g1_i1.p1 TRINITY_DN6322_c0_g1~~TRINITY_DN6322_c0_g1_i1.p1  ORF type:complete len:217 (-),score=27.77 TRINITY_DN6322_c0_g1_i1:327-977(-)